MIPPLEDGVLPEGVHDCTVDELEAIFGRFQRSDRRMVLAARIRAYLDEARRSGVVGAVIVDGSFVSGKDEPEDVDVIVVLRPGSPPRHEMRPFQYNSTSRFVLQRVYRFDALVYVEGSQGYADALDFFLRVRPAAMYTTRPRKGVLRIAL